jgi:hypothetical protein
VANKRDQSSAIASSIRNEDPVEAAVFAQELQDRLRKLESPEGADLVVPDLPLTDLLAVVIALALVSLGLLWWAY